MSTYTASSTALTDVQAAVNSASSGDLVQVPSGTSTWTNFLDVSNKTITLTGAGAGLGGTIIQHDGGDHRLILIEPGVQTGPADLSGFWLVSAGTAEPAGVTFGGTNYCKNVRMHHMKFSGSCFWTILLGVWTYGLIDHCHFSGSCLGIETLGLGDTDWETPLTLGTSDFFFIEDCTFDMDDWRSQGVACMEMFKGGRVVFRHNTLINGYFDTHDMARSGWPSSNAYEIYSNSWTCVGAQKWSTIVLCGGTGVVHSNAITGDWAHPISGIDYKTVDPNVGGHVLACDGTDPADKNVPGETGWICQYQVGSQSQGSTAVSYPLYTWNNTINGVDSPMEITDGSIVHLVEGRDFINNVTTPKPGYSTYTYPHPLQGVAPSSRLLIRPSYVTTSY